MPGPLTDIALLTIIQEKLDNARLVVRLNGHVIGYCVQDAKNKWIVQTAPPPPERVIRGSLQACAEWLYSTIEPEMAREHGERVMTPSGQVSVEAPAEPVQTEAPA
ncbi:MAG TPA: hypothetical protein VGJ60_07015 [Chloroflexota bacterium]|jgi:hypothetical protein